MVKHTEKHGQNCKTEADTFSEYRKRLPGIAEKVIESCDDNECYTHIDYDPIPSNESVVKIINKFREVLFPGYFVSGKLDPANLKYSIGQTVSFLFDILSEQIVNSIRHECFRHDNVCTDCSDQGQKIALDILNSIPELRKILSTDVTAAYKGDPAAKSHDEIIFSYPGLFAITVYRVAHKLF